MTPQPSQQDQQAQQAALVSLIAAPLAAAWQLIDLTDLKASLPKFNLAVAAIVQQYGKVAAVTAARHYSETRTADGVAGVFTVMPAKPAGIDDVAKSVSWATKGLWTTVPDPADPTKSVIGVPADVVESTKVLVNGVTEKAVLDAGRQTVFNAVQKDRKAKGWAREVEPGACSFCLLLATRGAVYKSEQTADFRSHDHCRCIAIPVFTSYEPTAQVREAQDIYRKVSRGKSGASARRAFRQAIEDPSSLSSPVLEPATT